MSSSAHFGARHAPRLIVITDTTVAAESELVARIERALSAARPGTVMVQLRDRQLDGRARLELGKVIVEMCRRTEQLFVVNDRLDLAVILDADGVHLGEGSVDPKEAREVLGVAAWVSCARHSVPAVAGTGADAVLLSPIAAPRKGNAALGIAALGAARAALSSEQGTLLYALGGIDASNAASCVEHGADGVAVIGAILDGRAPEPLLAELGILRS
jgi:thiamine-phosphate pyrophosphorylase